MRCRTGRGLFRRPAISIAATALGLLLLGGPAPAAARVTVTVEVAYGGVIVGGIGIFFYVGGSWEVPLAFRELPGALLDISPGRTRLGVPLPTFRPLSAAGAELPPRDGCVQIDLLRWRF